MTVLIYRVVFCNGFLEEGVNLLDCSFQTGFCSRFFFAKTRLHEARCRWQLACVLLTSCNGCIRHSGNLDMACSFGFRASRV